MAMFRGKGSTIFGTTRIATLLAVLIGAAITPTDPLLAQGGASTSSETTVETQIRPKRPKEFTKLKMAAGLAGRDTRDELVHNSAALSHIKISGSQKFSEGFSAFLSAGAYFGESSSAALYGDEGGSYSVVGIDHAYILIEPVKNLELEAGILGRNFSTIPAHFRTDGFLGLSESYTLGNKEKTYLSLSSSQILPSSSTAEKRAGSERSVPFLFMAGGELGHRFTRDTKLTTRAQYFQFSNLTSQAAFASRLYNDTMGETADSARFLNGFEGVQAGASLETVWTSQLKSTLHGGYILNQQARPGSGQGYAGAAAITLKRPRYEISPLVGVYYNERNVMPAAYVDVYNALGKTNRLATSVNLSVSIPEHDLMFYGRYVQTNLIEEEYSLSDRQIITVGMEATYDIL